MSTLESVLTHLRQTFTTKETCTAWLMRPNPFLGNKMPVELLTIDHDFDRVEAALEALDSGVFI